MPLSAGDILNGHYRIEVEIGRGAYGRVYRARDIRLDRPVAIKELLKGDADLASASFDDYALRFEREARIQAGFNHPNIVHVYELIQEDADRLYLVMELVDGESLRDHLARRGPLPIDEATRITAELLTGLAAMHADPRDLVHRDVKPSNILLTKDGHAKLADFGVAQVGDKSHRTHDGKSHPGTPFYMSPEQETTSGYLYPTSDIFSAGCVLFELLTGVAYKHAKKERKDLRGLRPDTPQWLVEVTARALETAPGDRLANAAEMARLLREAKPPPEKPEVLEARRTAEKARAEEAGRARLAAELQKQAEAARQQLEALQRQAEAEKAKNARREAELARKEADLVRSKQQAQREDTERLRRELAERAVQRRRRLVLGGAIGIPLLILLLAIWRPWLVGPGNSTPIPTTTAIVTPTNGPAALSTVIAGVTPTPEFTPTPSPTPASTDTPSPTPSPTPTPTDTPSPTITRTATPTRTKTPTPRPSPAITGTPVPSSGAVIVPENAAQIEEVARWNISAGAKQVAYSPDGKLLAIASANTVTCYDLATLAKVYSVTVDATVSALAFSPDGLTMALGAGAAVRIWRLGEDSARRVQAEQGGVTNVAFSPDGQIVASLSGRVYLWDVTDGMLIRSFGNGQGLDLVFSPDGETLVVGWTQLASVLRVGDGSLIRELEQAYYVRDVAISHDGQTIAGSDYYGSVAFWRAVDGSAISTEKRQGLQMVFSADDQILATSSYSSVGLVRLSDGLTLRTLALNPNYAVDLLFSPDGKTLLIVGSVLQFWGIPTP